jgi:hypothetical protein
MSKNKFVYLHTGCEWSEPWDAAFREKLSDRGIEYQECDLATVVVTRPGSFIGRFSERGRHYRDIYAHKSKLFDWCWPEPSAFALYDDKCLQAQWLNEHGYPQPGFEVVSGPEFCWNSFPVVHKKPEGSAAKNIKLIQGPAEIDPPCLLQEFCPNNAGDYRLTVIGDEVTTIGRKNRPGDFRASGSGNLYICETDPYLASLCWSICKKAGWATMGFDVLRRAGHWVIIEMSYTWPIYGITDWTTTRYDAAAKSSDIRVAHPVDTLLDCLFK